MPMRDGTGPMGKGPATGWGRGPCGAGMRQGLGQGMGRRFCAGWGVGQMPINLSKEEEKKILKAEKESLEQELELIKKKLAKE